MLKRLHKRKKERLSKINNQATQEWVAFVFIGVIIINKKSMETQLDQIKIVPLTNKDGTIKRDRISKLPLYKVLTPIRYETQYGIITVPAGYVTDLAQIPWFARWLFQVEDPRYRRAAILHDFLYSFQGGGMVANWNMKVLTFEESNRLLHDYARKDGTEDWKAEIMYCAVEIGGSGRWKSHNRDLKIILTTFIDMDS